MDYGKVRSCKQGGERTYARVIDRQKNLVASFVRLGASKPDLVLLELARNVRDDLLHVDALAGAVVSLELGG
jgi:hypothetical protein